MFNVTGIQKCASLFFSLSLCPFSMFMSELAELLKGHSLNPEVALLVIEIFLVMNHEDLSNSNLKNGLKNSHRLDLHLTTILVFD